MKHKYANVFRYIYIILTCVKGKVCFKDMQGSGANVGYYIKTAG